MQLHSGFHIVRQLTICAGAGLVLLFMGSAAAAAEDKRYSTGLNPSTPLAVSTDGSLLAFGTSDGSCIFLSADSGNLTEHSRTQDKFGYAAALVFEYGADSVLLLDKRHSLYRIDADGFVEDVAKEVLPDSMVFGCTMRPGRLGTLIPGYFDISLCTATGVTPVYRGQLGSSGKEGGGMIVDCCWAGDSILVVEIADLAAYNRAISASGAPEGQVWPKQNLLISRVSSSGEILGQMTLLEEASGNYSLAADELAAYLVSDHAVYLLDWSKPVPQAIQEVERYVSGSLRVKDGELELLAELQGWPPEAGMRDFEPSRPAAVDFTLVSLGPAHTNLSYSSFWHLKPGEGSMLFADWDLVQDVLYLQSESGVAAARVSWQGDTIVWPGQTSRFRPVVGGRNAGYYLEEDGTVVILKARQSINRFQYLLCDAGW